MNKFPFTVIISSLGFHTVGGIIGKSPTVFANTWGDGQAGTGGLATIVEHTRPPTVNTEGGFSLSVSTTCTLYGVATCSD